MVEYSIMEDTEMGWKCSECNAFCTVRKTKGGEVYIVGKPKFCPECGIRVTEPPVEVDYITAMNADKRVQPVNYPSSFKYFWAYPCYWKSRSGIDEQKNGKWLIEPT